MPDTTTMASSLYARHARAADRGAWSVERDILWSAIDATTARAQPDILAKLRDAALIESFHPVNLSRLIRLTWDDIDAGVVFSLELFEGFKHFHALRMYLDAVGYEPAITDDELRAIRDRADRDDLDPGDPMPPLVEFMLSEHLAAYFFRRLGEQAHEPQLAMLLPYIAADEVRHAQFASDLIAKRLAANPALVPDVLRAAASFRHYGTEAVGDVPVAMEGDDIAIRTFATRIERLCGIRHRGPPEDRTGALTMDITDRELTLLNFYRASELQGGLILGRLVEHVRDPELIVRLTEHSAEEVMHAQLWTETIVAVGGRPRPTADTFQARYASAIGTPTSLVEVLALTQVFERGVYRHFVQHLRRPGTHRCVQATLRRMLDDERGHLSWVQDWLNRQTGSRRAAIPALMHRYAEVDARIHAQLLIDYEWEELACAS